MDLADVQAVLLDMDGTLVDSDAAVERAWVSWCAEYGVDVAAALAVAPGRPAAGTIRELFPDLDEAGVEAAAARQLALQYDDLADVVAVPGMAELFAVLTRLDLPWAVVTVPTAGSPPPGWARPGCRRCRCWSPPRTSPRASPTPRATGGPRS